jgi:HPt (histidine-containing phosphotransfer) domain-containing protein
MEPIRSSFEDDADMMEIVREFASEMPQRADDIEQLVQSGQLRELRTLAHQLKGAGGGYGFEAITETAAALEGAIKRGDGESAIKEACGRVCEVLRAVYMPEAN